MAAGRSLAVAAVLWASCATVLLLRCGPVPSPEGVDEKRLPPPPPSPPPPLRTPSPPPLPQAAPASSRLLPDYGGLWDAMPTSGPDSLFYDVGAPEPDPADLRERPPDPAVLCPQYGWRARAKPARLYYGVEFMSELMVLRITLTEAFAPSDVIVVVENVRHHFQQRKPLVFERNRHRLEPFLPKVRHIIVDDAAMDPREGKHAQRKRAQDMDYHQRNSIANGLWDIQDSDVFLLADLDEIPRRDFLWAAKLCQCPEAINLRTMWFNYNLRCRVWPQTGGAWWMIGPQLVSGRHAKAVRPLRMLRWPPMASKRNPLRNRWHVLQRNVSEGWHLSWFMTAQQMQRKMKTFAHPETATAVNLDAARLERCRRECKNFDAREGTPHNLCRYERLPAPPDDLPIAVRRNTGYYAALLS
eukprot:TRINITY_DN2887_c0_g1_i5.p1 TRINITY_DN2887_c0_g1~~TRINITY_DN2887_c0_g1_i5.p1  ORF type:complete len:433 (+),score=138.87 TRINITY_DN2887_c0_g1_i5:58-1299(+)